MSDVTQILLQIESSDPAAAEQLRRRCGFLLNLDENEGP